MQIAGMAAGLYFTDMIIQPIQFGRSEFGDVAMFLIKGAVQFYIYKWFQCDSSGSYNKNPLSNMSFMEIVLGGLVGGVTLFFAGQLVNERRSNDFGGVMVRYGLEAIILNFVFGAAKNMMRQAAGSAASGYLPPH
jgi:hypothetical protein